jgi:hypothetical protein
MNVTSNTNPFDGFLFSCAIFQVVVILLFYFVIFYYTIFNVPKSFHTAPEGKPKKDVGMFLIDKLFTNVVLHLSAVIPKPTIIAALQLDVLFDFPPKILE